MMMKLAIYAITVNGAKQALRLKRALPYADVFVSEVGINECESAQPLTLPLSGFVEEKFSQYDGHIFIFASGIVSRVIAPLLGDKRTDPAVVCLDEQAKFAISMLSGHRGGANELTERVAYIVKATPVVTTASDVSESVSVDMLGAPFGWYLDPLTESAITPVSAAVVNDQPVAIVQSAGEKGWWTYEKRMPAHIICHDELEALDADEYQGAILISDEKQIDLEKWQNKLVLWRPKSIVLGIGCDRNTPVSVLKAGLAAFSDEFNISLASVYGLASIDLKADETGIIELAEENQWPFHTYAPQVLDTVKGIEKPSEYVKKVTGSCSVSEAAALKLSHTEKLVVSKWTFKQDGFNMTLACCRRAFSESLVWQNRKNWFGKKKHGGHGRHGMADQSNAAPHEEPIKVNAYGNEVVDGYQCKPKHPDLNRPMLYHRHHILLCEGGRCAKAGGKNLAHELRGLLKEMGLASGNKRIKVSRTLCAGACRNRSTMVIYQRDASETASVNNAHWLRNIEKLSENQWRELFLALAQDKPITQLLDPDYFAPIAAPSGDEQ
ncbi:cobalamin biosynthesis protein [Photobacterium sp. OFAV2-7]|uniref:cobalamin biosynthesis protein n=1 Tax=Photobacterium sp. OFAV2-7 TaxID=2917748 RepID=UPI001EF545E8|nr:cobalamin biosynthesis protein [Photobacterium sp. OFAV2-7]MCG7586511.1 cobalamin biosynthesis protein [Photobacterium sp. OFAV2-7]